MTRPAEEKEENWWIAVFFLCLLVAAVPVCFNIWLGKHKHESEAREAERIEKCSAEISVQLKDRIFVIPKGISYLSLDVYGTTRNVPELHGSLCQRKGAQPIKIESLRFWLLKSLSKYTDDWRPTTFSVYNYEALYPDKPIEDPYAKVERDMRNAGVSLKSLPVENGLYKWVEKKYGEYSAEHVYISATPDFISEANKPVVFRCHMRRGRESGSREDCSFSIWQGSLSFHVGDFFEERIRRDDWKQFYKDILEYISQIERKPVATEVDAPKHK